MDLKINDPGEFKKELEQLLNKYSVDSACSTPDFMLANYLMQCINGYTEIVQAKEEWFKDTNEQE